MWESAIYLDFLAIYLLKKREREMTDIQVILCHYGFFQVLKSMKSCDKEDSLTKRKRKKITEVAHASSASCLGVISIAGARLGRWG